jgi:hypothetical protein
MKKARKVRPAKAKEMAKALAGMGQNGDTMLAHINPQEAQLLDQVTDGGRINPHTGILAFDDGGDGGGDWGGDWSGDWGGGTGFGGDSSAGPGSDGGAWGGAGTGNDGGASVDGMGGRAADPGDWAAGRAAEGWDTSYTGEQAGRGYQALDDQRGLFGSPGRSLANAALGFIGLHNPGPQARGNGLTASPGFGFNPGALAGSYLGAAIGVPFLGEAGARGWNAMNTSGANIGTSVAADAQGPVGVDANGDPRMANALLGRAA